MSKHIKLDRESQLSQREHFVNTFLKHNIPLRTEKERLALLQEWLDEIGDEPLWVFGYGSLMWNPGIEYTQQLPAKIYGFQRKFCIDMVVFRASTSNPGLMLGLDRAEDDKVCTGIIFQISPKRVAHELDALFMRELTTRIYKPVWVDAKTEQGNIHALTFVVEKNEKRYVDALSLNEKAKRIAFAEGDMGTNRDYLYNTVEHLRELNINDAYLEELYSKVKQLRKNIDN